MTNLARFAQLPWDCILGAELAQNYKPHPSVYEAACGALRLPPDKVMMVAAHNSDLAAARACGLQTAFFPRLEEYGLGHLIDQSADQDWDIVAHDCADLAIRLGATA